MNDKTIMQKAADNIRVLAVSMVEKANSGHPGGAMGRPILSMCSSRSISFTTLMSLLGSAVTVSFLIGTYVAYALLGSLSLREVYP